MDSVDLGPYGGGSLAHVADMVESPSGELFVLDPQYKKVAVYRPDGSFDRLILGGAGSGPGEFALPVALAYSADRQSLFVYDYQLLRTTEFDLSGEFRSVLSTPFRSKDMLVEEGHILLALRPAREFLVADVPLDEHAEAIRQIPVSAEDLEFSPPGLLGLFANIGDTVALASLRPGIWYVRTGSTWSRRGTPAVSQDGIDFENDWYASAQAHGAASLGHDRLLVIYSVANLVSFPPKRLAEFRVDIADIEGRILARGTFPQFTPAITGSADGRHIFVAVLDPFPQVIKYEVTVD